MPNHQQLTEVLCAVWFDPAQNDWDSTYFGKYYEKIAHLGYTDKKEQKQIEFRLEPAKKNSEYTEGNPRMVFVNPVSNSAIILSAHFISFHKLHPYESWERLITEIANPGLKIYKELGLGKGIKEVQSLYLNRLLLTENEKITNHFNFLPTIEESVESNILFQAKYDMAEGKILQLKLNGNRIQDKIDLIFECSCFAQVYKNDDFSTLAEKAHKQVNIAYKQIVKL